MEAYTTGRLEGGKENKVNSGGRVQPQSKHTMERKGTRSSVT